MSVATGCDPVTAIGCLTEGRRERVWCRGPSLPKVIMKKPTRAVVAVSTVLVAGVLGGATPQDPRPNPSTTTKCV